MFGATKKEGTAWTLFLDKSSCGGSKFIGVDEKDEVENYNLPKFEWMNMFCRFVHDFFKLWVGGAWWFSLFGDHSNDFFGIMTMSGMVLLRFAWDMFFQS